MFKKRGMSPIVATVLLIAFAVALGAMVMKLGQKPIGSEDCKDVVITKDNLCNIGGVLYPTTTGKDGKPTTCKEFGLDPTRITAACP